MISFVIPDDDLKATGLNWNSGLGVQKLFDFE